MIGWDEIFMPLKTDTRRYYPTVGTSISLKKPKNTISMTLYPQIMIFLNKK